MTSVLEQEAVTRMQATGEQSAPRVSDSGGWARPGLRVTTESQTGGLERTAGSFSARLVADEEGGNETAVLSICGELDLLTAPIMLEVLLPVLERGTALVVVDLSEVSFMDSSGVHVLTDALELLESQNRRLAIACHEHGQVHKVLGLVGLLDAVGVHRSRESAVIGGRDRIRHDQPDFELDCSVASKHRTPLSLPTLPPPEG